MTRLTWLEAETLEFPPSSEALSDPNGLLAVGGDLSPARLLCAYQRGIFPWYNPDQPILWWSPDPRMILIPEEVHVARSLAKHMRRSNWKITINTSFERTIKLCAAPRSYSSGTWISPPMLQAYCTLHKLGYAHSLEVWQNTELVGGIYGVSLGRVFFGESMFSLQPNASKVALVVLARWLNRHHFALIDCQVANPHLTSMGAKDIPRVEFEEILQAHTSRGLIDTMQTLWRSTEGKEISCDGLVHD